MGILGLVFAVTSLVFQLLSLGKVMKHGKAVKEARKAGRELPTLDSAIRTKQLLGGVFALAAAICFLLVAIQYL